MKYHSLSGGDGTGKSKIIIGSVIKLVLKIAIPVESLKSEITPPGMIYLPTVKIGHLSLTCLKLSGMMNWVLGRMMSM